MEIITKNKRFHYEQKDLEYTQEQFDYFMNGENWESLKRIFHFSIKLWM